jgi:hypothetical protein
MRGLSHSLLYVRYFFEADTKEARKLAAKQARDWCIQRNPHWTDAYWAEYSQFTTSYMTNYCHLMAKKKVQERTAQ